eukprot:1484709-Amphidinium_carterae.1
MLITAKCNSKPGIFTKGSHFQSLEPKVILSVCVSSQYGERHDRRRYPVSIEMLVVDLQVLGHELINSVMENPVTRFRLAPACNMC